MANCAQCGAENQPGALFCEMCGTRLATAPAQPPAQPQPAATVPAPAPVAGGLVSCPTCGASAIPGEAFCENCGAALAPVAPAAPSQPAATVPAPPQPPAQPAPQPVYPPPQPIAPPVPVAGTSACPSCGAVAIPGEAFCENCGAMLSAPSNLTPRQPSPAPAPQPPAPQPPIQAAPPAQPAPPPAQPAPPPPPAPVGLTSLQGMAFEIAGTRVALPAQAEAIIGRQDPASGHFPDLDMTPHGAMEHGVGRRHARIFVRGGQVQIEDLDSTNGTLVNKQKLKPRQPTVLAGDEELRFGTLAVTFRRGA